MSSQPSSSSNTAQSATAKPAGGLLNDIQAVPGEALAAFKTELKAHVYVVIAIAAGLGSLAGVVVGHAL